MSYVWDVKTIPWADSGRVRSIAIGGGIICVITNTHKSYASTDGGDSWVQGTVPGSSAVRNGITHDGVRFCTVGAFPNTCATSVDGVSWVAGTMPSGVWRDVVHNGSFFCAVGSDSRSAVSADGLSWTGFSSGLSSTFSVAWNGAVFCAPSSTSAFCNVSSNGSSWVAHPSSITHRDIAWNEVVFCAIPNNASTDVSVSADGITWVQHTVLPSEARTSVAADAGLFITDDITEGAYFSAAGVDQPWAPSTTPSIPNWAFSAVGSNLVALASSDSDFIVVAPSAALPPGAFWTQRVNTTEVA